MNILMLGCLHCAASCVQLANGSNACVGFERFVTSAIGEGGVLLEFDSTDYDAMEALTREINGVQMKFLGSATSAIVDGNDPFSPVSMEITNLTYGNHRWNVSVVAVDGVLFIGPRSCVDIASCDLTTSFRVGDRFTAAFGAGSGVVADGLGRVEITLHEVDLPLLTQCREDQKTLEANFSVGLIAQMGGAMTQASMCIQRAKGAVGTSVQTFTRQVAPYVAMQFERNATHIYARLWAQCTLPNATVVYVRYAWGEEPRPPTSYNVVSQCPLLELSVVVADWADNKGNFTLYVVIQQGKAMGRILTQVKPLIVNTPQSPIHVGIEIEVLQGLQLASVYRGPVADGVFINNSDVDALLTFVARSSGVLVIESLVAIHTHTEAQRAAVAANATCEGLIARSCVRSTRSVHAIKLERWIQFVGIY